MHDEQQMSNGNPGLRTASYINNVRFRFGFLSPTRLRSVLDHGSNRAFPDLRYSASLRIPTLNAAAAELPPLHPTPASHPASHSISPIRIAVPHDSLHFPTASSMIFAHCFLSLSPSLSLSLILTRRLMCSARLQLPRCLLVRRRRSAERRNQRARCRWNCRSLGGYGWGCAWCTCQRSST